MSVAENICSFCQARNYCNVFKGTSFFSETERTLVLCLVCWKSSITKKCYEKKHHCF